MQKFILVLLLSVVSVFGQRTDTIYKQIYNNSVGGYSPTVPTIGQGVHFIYIAMRDAPGHTCNPVYPLDSYDFFFQASYDNVAFFNIPVSIISSTLIDTGKLGRLYQGKGPFPYIKAGIQSSDTTNCRYDGYYSGSLYPSDFNSITIGAAFTNVTTKSGVFSVSGHNGFYAPNTFTTSLYGITICNVTAGQTVTLESQDTDGNNFPYLVLPNMAAGQCHVWPIGNIPWVNTQYPSYGLSLKLANSTTVYYTANYRGE